jgi:hypothetical protein
MKETTRNTELTREILRLRQAVAEIGRMLSSPYGGARERAQLHSKAPTLASILTEFEDAEAFERRAA